MQQQFGKHAGHFTRKPGPRLRLPERKGDLFLDVPCLLHPTTVFKPPISLDFFSFGLD
jgi:hypothetical protein